jgi:DNA helicase-2/ATP-dependent DNA helicase PcrA
MVTFAMSLTAEQQAAVACQQNLLLTACPGSGKTRTITARLAKEIETLRGSPRAVACITYTNAAVQEIEQRIAAHLLEGDEQYYTICTIHAFCLSAILRPFAWLVPGFAGSMRVLTRDRPEFAEIARYAAEKVRFFNLQARDLEAFESLALDASGRLVGFALRNEPVARAAPYFWHRCQELGFVDFSSILYKSFCLLRDHPMVARSLAAHFAAFLIDEFQDTTELQIEILKLIHAQGRSVIFAVGDHAQSIFGFTGARPELIEPFAAHINARVDLSLTGNFRSAPIIVEHAERLIPRSPPMRSVGTTRSIRIEPVLIQTGETIDAIREHFLPLLADHDIGFGEAAILSKDWASLFPLSRALREFDVPVVGPGARPYRRSRLFATLAEQLCGYLVDPGAHNIRQLERALFYAIQDVTAGPSLEVFSFVGRITMVRLLREASRLADLGSASRWLDAMSEATGNILHRDGFIDQEQSGLFFASVQEMKADMRRQNVDIANLSIEDLGLFAAPNKALRLTTIHNAKGREFGAVAIINVREGTFPFRYADDVEAEKRLLYVAITRAERLLMYIAQPDQWGNPVSRFLGSGGIGIA